MSLERSLQRGVDLNLAEPGFSQRWSKTRVSVRENAPFLLSVLCLVVTWESLGRILDHFALPPFSAVMASLWTMLVDGTLVGELAPSLTILTIGLLISISAGILIGTLMGISRYVDWALGIYVNAGMVAPMIAFVPVFVIVFGLGWEPRLATVIIYSIFPVIVNTQAGIRSANRSLVEMGHSFGASRGQLFWRVRLPDALELIQGGVLIASSRGVKGLISGEVLIALVGLGGLVHRYGNAFSMTELYGLMIFLIALALCVRSIVGRSTSWIIKAMGSPRS